MITFLAGFKAIYLMCITICIVYTQLEVQWVYSGHLVHLQWALQLHCGKV